MPGLLPSALVGRILELTVQVASISEWSCNIMNIETTTSCTHGTLKLNINTVVIEWLANELTKQALAQKSQYYFIIFDRDL